MDKAKATNDNTNKKAKARPIRRGDGPQIVYEYIRGEIIAMRMPAGTRIDEYQIVNKLGLSRTPVRQAFMRLATEGLVELLPNQGARVPPLDLEEIRSFFEAFEYLMRATSYLAAKYRTDADLAEIREQQQRFENAVDSENITEMINTNETFHLAIAKAGKNSELTRFMGDLLTKTLRLDGIWYSRQTPEDATRVYRRSREEHASIVEAIVAGNPPQSMEVSSLHVTSFKNPFLRYLQLSDAAEFTPPS